MGLDKEAGSDTGEGVRYKGKGSNTRGRKSWILEREGREGSCEGPKKGEGTANGGEDIRF
jgi:hypothetical protein